MVMLPDTNVLVAAYRSDHAHHFVASQWLKTYLNEATEAQKLMLPMQVVAGFMRLVTNKRIFALATPPAQALDYIDWLLGDPKVQLLTSSSEWPVMRRLVMDQQLSDNHIPDAWLASLCISLSEPFVTFDKGFKQLLPRSLLVLLPPSK
jgi:uncharacterized protein